MALALSFDRAFENPFLRRRLPARSMYSRTPTYTYLHPPTDISPRIRPRTYTRTHIRDMVRGRRRLPARARVCASAYPGIRGALIPF